MLVHSVSCPHCLSVKVVRNGRKGNGKQNLLCKQCRKQFQAFYTYRACSENCSGQVIAMLLRGSGVRDTALLLGISIKTVLRTIVNQGAAVEIKPLGKQYRCIQIDELWSYVGRKEKKVWILYALCADSGEILAFTMGKRRSHTVRQLMLKLKHLDIELFCTDNWEAFSEVLPKAKHMIGKQFTKKIEGTNTFLRTRLRRLVRRTVCFSKKLLNHYYMFKLLVYYKNIPASYI